MNKIMFLITVLFTVKSNFFYLVIFRNKLCIILYIYTNSLKIYFHTYFNYFQLLLFIKEYNIGYFSFNFEINFLPKEILFIV